MNKHRARLALATFENVLVGILRNGQGVNLSMFQMAPTITGTFATLSHSDHQVEINFTLGKELAAVLPHITVFKEGFRPEMPVITKVTDVLMK